MKLTDFRTDDLHDSDETVMKLSGGKFNDVNSVMTAVHDLFAAGNLTSRDQDWTDRFHRKYERWTNGRSLGFSPREINIMLNMVKYGTKNKDEGKTFPVQKYHW